MNPWQTLNIEPTDDKKAIKKAYAVLIKQYKPDEHPEKFQEIQSAYKDALEILKWEFQNNQINTENKNTKIVENKHLIVNVTNTKDQLIVDELLKKTDTLLKSELLKRENLKNWEFLEQSNQILDLQNRELFSQKLFALISQYNLKYYKRNKKTIITTRIIKYINDYVNWDIKWKDYTYLFDKDCIHVMYMNLESDDEIDSIEHVDLLIRLRALFSDLVMSYAIAGISSYFAGYAYQETLKLTIYIFVLP